MQSIDLSSARWRKSSRSSSGGGACVEVCHDFGSVVPVRDGKDPHGPVLLFPAGGWSAFVIAVKDYQLPG
ncbi:DUF397 domain-containing protein [Streptomyces sp. WM6378]|uniref:DUF397 domain-containing protein n=1 Tax=Streptomyces sp. WM6378 TaxID=1415557 RepID=UPI0006AF2DE7|nr:DUF397 domain-containing protein [Streptomyces sp. WM6378]KOU35247.1 hypothetical protein ADK54_38090 [Streptomyces sp. WM6378]